MRIADSGYESGELDRLREILNRNGFSCKIYVSEWNDTISSRNYLNDSCYRGCDLIVRMSEMMGRADMVNPWIASDWVSNYYDVRGVANGGNGLLTKDTICKPAYYALQFLNSLAERLLISTRNCIATETAEKHYYILLTNYKELGSGYYMEEEDFSDPRRVKDLFDDKEPLKAEITIRNVPAGHYVVKKRTVSPKEGSLLSEWGRFDFDSGLSSQEVRYIRQSCYPRMSMKKMESKDGTLVIREELLPHEMDLIHIYEASE